MYLKRTILLILAISAYTALQASISPFLSERDAIHLENWTFLKGDKFNAQSEEVSDLSWEKIKVPHTYNMDAIHAVGYYQGMAWYRHTLDANLFVPGRRVFIRFEGVGQEAIVYLNGEKVGTHSGSYSAFTIELTKNWNYNDKNLLAVKVDNSTHFRTIPVSKVLFNQYGGIYRPVALFSTPTNCISPLYHASSGLFIETKSVANEKAQIEVRAHISGKNQGAPQKLEVEVRDRKGKLVASESKSFQIKNDKSQIEKFTLDIIKPFLWDGKKNPYLYKATVTLRSNGKEDKVSQTFGVRTFKVDPNKGFILNGAPYRLNGVCRHQEWEQNGNALSNQQHQTDIDFILEMGASGLRLAHYQQADYMYQLADESGLVVWAEIPFVHSWSGREQSNAKSQLTELILQNYNHPSICFWGLWNEVRAYNNKNTPCVTLTKELNELAHKLDPSRPTTSASDRPVDAPMSLISDLQGWNKYFGWYYGAYSDLGSWLDQTHAEYPEVKISVSEYGAGGNIAHQDHERGEKPKGDYFPEQEQTLCHEQSWAVLKNRDYLWGSFIWNMFDFGVNGWYRGGENHRNHKGLITFDRKVKKDAFYFYKANWSEAPVLYIAEKRNNIHKEASPRVKVYCNVPAKVELSVNGKKVSKVAANEIRIAIWENIKLQKGNNKIEVNVTYKGQSLQDEVVWTYKPVQK